MIDGLLALRLATEGPRHNPPLFQGEELERGFFVTDVTEPERLAVVVLERLPVGQFFLLPVVLPDPG